MAAPENPFLRAGDCSTRFFGQCYAFWKLHSLHFKHVGFSIGDSIFASICFQLFSTTSKNPRPNFGNRNVEAIDPRKPLFSEVEDESGIR